MNKYRVRCQKCRAVLRKNPDIPEQIEYWTWDQVEANEVDPGFVSIHLCPVPATEEQIKRGGGDIWKETVGPFWTCQRCGEQNDAEHVGEELSGIDGMDEPPGF